MSSVTIKCVLLLWNVFSHDRVCSLTVQHDRSMDMLEKHKTSLIQVTNERDAIKKEHAACYKRQICGVGVEIVQDPDSTVRVSAPIYTYIRVCVGGGVRVRMCVYVCVCVCMYIYMCVHLCTYMRIYTYTCIISLSHTHTLSLADARTHARTHARTCARTHTYVDTPHTSTGLGTHSYLCVYAHCMNTLYACMNTL